MFKRLTKKFLSSKTQRPITIRKPFKSDKIKICYCNKVGISHMQPSSFLVD